MGARAVISNTYTLLLNLASTTWLPYYHTTWLLHHLATTLPHHLATTLSPRDFLARLQGDLAPSQPEDSPSVFETEYLPSLDPAREQETYSFTAATRYEILDSGEPSEEAEAVVVSLLSLAGSLQSLPRTTEPLLDTRGRPLEVQHTHLQLMTCIPNSLLS